MASRGCRVEPESRAAAAPRPRRAAARPAAGSARRGCRCAGRAARRRAPGRAGPGCRSCPVLPGLATCVGWVGGPGQRPHLPSALHLGRGRPGVERRGGEVRLALIARASSGSRAQRRAGGRRSRRRGRRAARRPTPGRRPSPRRRTGPGEHAQRRRRLAAGRPGEQVQMARRPGGYRRARSRRSASRPSVASRRSAASARFSPAPTAAPSIRAMVGTVSRPTRSKARYTAPSRS